MRFVASKTRVAPLKSQTIPRLELLSAVLLARLISSITQAIEGEVTLSEPRCFTDSTVSLFWIRGVEKSWKPFVQNRVSEIRKLSSPDCWSHCAGKDNPADIPSRGLSPEELAASNLWMNGPDWLSDGVVVCDSPPPTMPEECRTEMRASDSKKTIGLLTTAGSPGIGQLMKCGEFSSLNRLLAVTAAVLRFCRLLLTKVRKDAPTSADDLDKAETLWIIEAQKELVKDVKFPHWRKQFDLFQDDEKVWRCGGRIQNANVSFSAKHPVLLPRNHFLTTLFVRRAHERVAHGGVKATLTELRSRFWIVQGRNFVKHILGQCTVCRRFGGKPYRAPLPPPLPTFRVEESPPFAHTGVDFAGPLYVKKTDGTTRKVWLCLFTCCVTRAVHLDLIGDLSTPTFLRCLKRFAARRGLPSKMVSDNGKTFKAAAKVIESIVSHEEVQRYLSGLGVKWMFNLPKAPWWGGVFERLIQSTKRCLRKIIGQANFSYDELLTAVVEVKSVLNSRPLSYVSVEDLDEPLTPSHLLSGRRILSLPDHLYCDPEEDNFDVEPSTLTRRLVHINKTLDQFWKRWRREYLLELRESHRYHRGATNPSPVSVGDVVIVHSDNQPRGFWRLGRVEKVLVGRDDKIRGAILKVAGQGRQAKLLQRPLQLIYPLEIRAPSKESERSEPEPEQSSNTSDDSHTQGPEAPQEVRSQVEPQDPPPRRRKRIAAIEARDRLMAQALSQTENDL